MKLEFDHGYGKTRLPEMCAERRRLTDEFTAALKELVDLQNQQIQAVVRHDSDFARFDILVSIAMQKKREAKYALLKHLEQHRCDPGEEDSGA